MPAPNTTTVDGDEGQQRGRRPPAPASGEAESARAQQAVHRVGLAADLGRHPARDHRDEARRPHGQREAVQQPPVVEPVRARAPTGSHEPSASISKPSPTMTRKAQNTIATGGQSLRIDRVEAL